MDSAALAGRLEAIEGRLAGTDAERRAAALCARELRAGGRRPGMQTLWFRPQRQAPRALYAALGIAGSVVAVDHPQVGLAVAAGALLAALLEAVGLPLAGLLLARRATQNVVAPPPGGSEGKLLLVLTASVDAPRHSLLWRLEHRVAGRLMPGAAGLLVLALAAVSGCAGARVAGAEGAVIGVVQLVPSAVLILLMGVFLDATLTQPADRASAAGPAAALATAAALDAHPPRALAPEVLIAGAGEAGAAGMRAYVRARRRELDASDIVVVHLGAASGPVRFLRRDGEHFGVRLHPRLAELADAVPGTRAAETRGRSGARVARGARWPAIALEGEPRALATAALRLISAIDDEVVQARSR